MNVLIVDDEPGIREGMAAYLRIQGRRVVTADSVRAARAVLEVESFDAIVTDWALGDGDAAPILSSVDCPCFVVSGHPELVVEAAPDAVVLTKPVMPVDLAAMLADLVDSNPNADSVARPDAVGDSRLPIDTAARVDAVREVCEVTTVRDDGEFVSIEAPLPNEDVVARLRRIASDDRVIADGLGPHRDPATVQVRMYRDSRPDGVMLRSPTEDWPAGYEIAVDLDKFPCGVEQFLSLLDRVSAEELRVHILNVPASTRKFIEALGRGDELPMRVIPGPQLPAVLSELWR